MRSVTTAASMPVMQGRVTQLVFRWLDALTQGEHGNPK